MEPKKGLAPLVKTYLIKISLYRYRVCLKLYAKDNSNSAIPPTNSNEGSFKLSILNNKIISLMRTLTKYTFVYIIP